MGASECVGECEDVPLDPDALDGEGFVEGGKILIRDEMGEEAVELEGGLEGLRFVERQVGDEYAVEVALDLHAVGVGDGGDGGGGLLEGLAVNRLVQ